MKFTFTEKRMDSSEELRAYSMKKIGKLDRLFKNEGEAYVTFSIERGRHKAEITIHNNGMFYRASELTNDMYASVDSGVAAIERQIRRNKTRLEKKLREGALEKEVLPAYETADADARDYASVIASAPLHAYMGQCTYCGHCRPCPMDIDIAMVNKFYDLAIQQPTLPESLREHYRALEHGAGECVGCQSCESRCPFGVKIAERMAKAAELFEG